MCTENSKKVLGKFYTTNEITNYLKFIRRKKTQFKLKIFYFKSIGKTITTMARNDGFKYSS